ncbi:hypothetical protein ASG29_00450 [Sphingomonas sp. Leaf412]|uniref:hypothetical protein n=1 Tax=Sphingomonas sp. Leaf412 TaxID=1736370 RepID=UPI0006FBF173|nr:hypothetical protein [Sphingomonas sp. Leaf412]KQT34675.1 hypothetical protein ASG29_00450 [Sphingomonas sp. Leaf412]
MDKSETAREARIVAANGRVLQVQESRAYKLDAGARQRFVDTLAATCNVRAAARAAGVTQAAVYRERQRDAGFAAAWRDALSLGYDRLELAMVGHLLDRMGVDAPDPEAAPAGVPDLAGAIGDRTATPAELQLVLAMLMRRHGVEHRKPQRTRRVATAAETDALIRRKLDALAATDGAGA